MGLTKDYEAQNSLNMPCLLPAKLSNTKKIDNVCHWQLFFFFTSLAFVYKQESQHRPCFKKKNTQMLDSFQSLLPWTLGLLTSLSLSAFPFVCKGIYNHSCITLL